MKYIKGIFVGISQFTNVIMGGNPNELLSARAYRTKNKILMFIINRAFFDKDHCKKAYIFELNNDQLPEYKDKNN